MRSRKARQPDEIDSIISEQTVDYRSGSKRPLGDFLDRFVAEARAAGKDEISILELGCANGATLRHLQSVCPDMTVRFFGLELTDFLVDDLNAKFPDARARSSPGPTSC